VDDFYRKKMGKVPLFVAIT